MYDYVSLESVVQAPRGDKNFSVSISAIKLSKIIEMFLIHYIAARTADSHSWGATAPICDSNDKEGYIVLRIYEPKQKNHPWIVRFKYFGERAVLLVFIIS